METQLIKVKDTFQAFLVEGAKFTSGEEYPIICDWMVPKEPPKRVIPFDKLSEYTDSEIRESTICFYCADERFLKIRKNPKAYVSLFKRCRGIIGFNISVFYDMPMWKQKSVLGDNLSLDFFYGIRNTPVYPNIRFGSDETRDDFLAAIPKHSLVAIGTYGFINSNVEKDTWREFLNIVLPIVEPWGLIVYGPVPDSVFSVCGKYGVTVFPYESFMSKRMKEVADHE
jgi:hypothetical protein